MLDVFKIYKHFAYLSTFFFTFLSILIDFCKVFAIFHDIFIMNNEISSENFLKRLDILLKKQGKKRVDLAKDVGFSQQSYTDWKGRNTFPKVTILLECADFLNTSVEYLITGKESISESEYAHLSQDERELIDSYRKCSQNGKSEICNFADFTLSKEPKEKATGIG